MLFFLPSLIFWTADVSKESIMMFALGLTAYAAAKFLARQPGGFILVVPGVFIAAYVRPNELLLILAGFAVAMMVPTAAARRHLGGLRRLISLVFLGGLLAIAVGVTFKYLHHGSGGSLSLQKTNANNQGTGLGFGSSGVPYSTNLATFPRDIYEVLFNPLPFNWPRHRRAGGGRGEHRDPGAHRDVLPEPPHGAPGGLRPSLRDVVRRLHRSPSSTPSPPWATSA